MGVDEWKKQVEKQLANNLHSIDVRVMFCKFVEISPALLNLNTTGQLFAWELIRMAEQRGKLQKIIEVCNVLEINIPELNTGYIQSP